MFEEIWLSCNEVVDKVCITSMKIYFHFLKDACVEMLHEGL